MILVMVAPISSQAKLSHHMRKLTSGAGQQRTCFSRCKVYLKQGMCQSWRSTRKLSHKETQGCAKASATVSLRCRGPRYSSFCP